MKKHILPILLCILLFMTAVLPISAAESDSITVLFKHDSKPVEQTSFQIYKAANWDGSSYTFVSPFSNYQIRIPEDSGSEEWKTLSSTLAAYIARDAVPALASGKTDASGSVRFDGLTDGLYLIIGAATQYGDLLLIPQPTIVTVPCTNSDGTVDRDVVTEPKYDYRQVTAEPLERRALKIWEDNGNEQSRPQEIAVQLLCDGKVYEEQILNAANNWRYTWENLDAAHDWKLTEKEVPKNYTVQIEQQGVTFTVTNTLDAILTPSVPNTSSAQTGDSAIRGGDSTLPQTGLLWWPVPVLVVTGALAMFIGIFLILRKKDELDG